MTEHYSEEQILSNIKEIKDICEKYPDTFPVMLTKGRFKHLNEFIEWYTPLLKDNFYSMATKCYWVINGIKSWDNPLVCCLHCHKPLKHKNAKVFRGYIRQHCNVSCSQADVNVYKKIQKVKIERYGSVCNKKKGDITRKKIRYAKLVVGDYEQLLSPESEFLEYNMSSKHIFKFRCKKCGNIIYSNFQHFNVNGEHHVCRCRRCFPTIHTRSVGENEVFEFCKSICMNNNLSICSNTRTLMKHNGRSVEFDIYIKEKNLLIEYDGSYYHSEEFWNSTYRKFGKNRLNKLDKTEMGEKYGFRVLHINEDEWKCNREELQKILEELITKGKLHPQLSKDIEFLNREIYSILDIPDDYQFSHFTKPKLIKRLKNHVLSCGEICCKKVKP